MPDVILAKLFINMNEKFFRGRTELIARPIVEYGLIG